MTGMPPPTLASNPRSTPLRDAAAKISSPWTPARLYSPSRPALPLAASHRGSGVWQHHTHRSVPPRYRRRDRSRPAWRRLARTPGGKGDSPVSRDVEIRDPHQFDRHAHAAADECRHCRTGSSRRRLPTVPNPIMPTPITRLHSSSPFELQRFSDSAHGLARPMFIFNQRKAYILIAAFTKADPGRDRDLGLSQQQLRKFQTTPYADRAAESWPTRTWWPAVC